MMNTDGIRINFQIIQVELTLLKADFFQEL
jgi:hypothetical protein